MDKVYTNNFIIFQDDWNAVVGDCNDNWSNVVGRFTIGKSNQRGNRFLEFCTKNNIILTNTIRVSGLYCSEGADFRYSNHSSL